MSANRKHSSPHDEHSWPQWKSPIAATDPVVLANYFTMCINERAHRPYVGIADGRWQGRLHVHIFKLVTADNHSVRIVVDELFDSESGTAALQQEILERCAYRHGGPVKRHCLGR